MSEDTWQTHVIGLAHTFHWRVAHFRAAMTKSGRWVTPVQADGKGFPDLILVRGNDLLAVELKAEKGRVSPEQQDWLTALDRVHRVEAMVWRPSDRDVVLGKLEA